MFRVLSIVFCVIACILIATAVVVGALVGIWWGVGEVVAAAFCVLLMLVFKNGNPFKRKKERKTDFMNTDEENEEIRKEQEAQGGDSSASPRNDG